MGGISHDIVPRNQPGPEPKDGGFYAPTAEEIDQDSSQVNDWPAFEIDEKAKKSKIADEFFEYKPEKAKKTPKENPSKFVNFITSIWSLWIIFFVLLAILAYQNRDMIKRFLGTDTPVVNVVANTTTNTVTTPSSNDDTTTSSTTAPTTAPAATTTTPAVLDKSKVLLEVLNGNGITGSAAKVVTALKAAGFKIAKTTNAKRFTYTKTEIYYKTGKIDAANAVATALSSRQTELVEDSTTAGIYDVVVVVGKN
ncbi:MAG: LytR C-terminal domain-containing protein [Candidatus Berkelbacteria bacterium]|nr:LytR C-terminal domain-containing protein [Candidatus Berkelbacteria bacterium]